MFRYFIQFPWYWLHFNDEHSGEEHKFQSNYLIKAVDWLSFDDLNQFRLSFSQILCWNHHFNQIRDPISVFSAIFNSIHWFQSNFLIFIGLDQISWSYIIDPYRFYIYCTDSIHSQKVDWFMSQSTVYLRFIDKTINSTTNH